LGRDRCQRIFVAGLLSALVVCGAQPALAAHGADRQDSLPSGSANAITDETGRRVTIPAEVRHIVTLSPDLTETIYALGLEDRLAGDTADSDTPPAAREKPHVGTSVNPNLEAVVALHPDMVLASTSINRAESVDALRRLGFAVYTSNPHTVRGTLDSIARVAGVVGASAQGAALVARLQARLDALHARLGDLPLVHVLFVVWEDPLISIGQNTFIADALRWAGAESVILSDQNWPRVGLEEIVRVQPEYIVLTSDHLKAEGTGGSDLRGRNGWKELRAVEMGHVAVISEGVDRPSPGLIDAIEELAHALHPEAFKDQREDEKVKGESGPRLQAIAVMPTELSQCAR
jgi:iron complex transport system substrate-binding protein